MQAERYLEFKSVRQLLEWQRSETHPALQVIVLAAARWHWLAAAGPAVVTALLRTPREQKAIYPASSGGRSPHEFGRAADLRVSALTPAQAESWADWINSAFAYRGRSGLMTALVHEVGGRGRHLHVQVGPGESSPESEVNTTAAPVV
ncbi:MAG: M15 family metallopeptidase [Candidatus Glassbacteria bacterium]|nr:M15 family metallopeptidase [Candidatus Glassbacteria bacterium]